MRDSQLGMWGVLPRQQGVKKGGPAYEIALNLSKK